MSPKRRKAISRGARDKLHQARVARLATYDARFALHIVPICFAYDGNVFYTAIDQKPKRVKPERLTRLRNILGVPQVALLVDEYDEDWTQLWYILIRGKAKLIPTRDHRERAWAIRKLRAKYPQYSGSMLPDDAPIIRITPNRTTLWGKIKFGTELRASTKSGGVAPETSGPAFLTLQPDASIFATLRWIALCSALDSSCQDLGTFTSFHISTYCSG